MEKLIIESRYYWDDFAASFEKFDDLMKQSWEIMIKHMELSKAANILEIGAGRGSCSKAIVDLSNPRTCLLVTDLSSEMLKYAQEKLAKIENVRIKEADALDLKEISSSSVDRYVANMTLHLVPDADLMLREARRVLKKDGIGGFSVWGDIDQSPFFACRDGGRLNKYFDFGRDIDLAKQRFKNAGFSSVVVWRQQCVMETFDFKKAADFWADIEKKDIKGKDKEWYDRLVSAFSQTIKQGQPIGLEALIIIAK